MENESCLQKRYYDVSKLVEFWEILLISIGVFLTPLVVPQLLTTIFGAKSFIATNSQFVVGAIVNTCLIIAGINAKGWKKIMGIVILPSISSLLSGSVLHLSNIYTVYMIPAIWLGNFAIVFLFKYLFVAKKINYILASIAGILVKCACIFGGYKILLLANIIPQNSKVAQVLFTSMGINQVITASMGCVIAFALVKLLYPHLKQSSNS